jgi:anti-anti-sigma factor
VVLDTSSMQTSTFGWVADGTDNLLSISFFGDLDLATIDECRASLEGPLSGPEPVILLDLSELTFADTLALRFFIDAKRRATGAGKRMLLTRVSRPFLRVLEAAGLTSWFDYSDGQAPVMSPCVICDREVIAGSRRCSHCGAAL